jgi:deoxyribonuclease V
MNSNWIFPKSIDLARLAQKEMAAKVILEDQFKEVRHIAGVDVSCMPFDPEQMIFAAIVVLSYPSLEVVETQVLGAKQEFPYIPGLLGFREVPILLEVYNQLSIRPDLLMVDGHGVSHPQKLGVATHLGILLDAPTIGVAKSILVGKAKEPLKEAAGSMVSLERRGEEMGKIVRTKKGCSPLIISSGHKVSLQGAVEWVSRCLKGYRLPEPTRKAHLAANEYRVLKVSQKLR